jgi:hypothetical protein
VKNLSAEEAVALQAELAQLNDWQLEALKTAAYVPMSLREWKLYEVRLGRIREIRKLLAP